MRRRHWLAIIGDVAARDLARGDWRRLPLAGAIVPRPAAGDRIAVLRTRRPSFVTAATFIGTADVRGDTGSELELRHRFVAPAGHEIPLGSVAHLTVSRGWTHERLGALRDLAVPIIASDHEAIEAALRSVALAFGPAPSRPAHSVPRTPGRRRLITARLLARPHVAR